MMGRLQEVRKRVHAIVRSQVRAEVTNGAAVRRSVTSPSAVEEAASMAWKSAKHHTKKRQKRKKRHPAQLRLLKVRLQPVQRPRNDPNNNI